MFHNWSNHMITLFSEMSIHPLEIVCKLKSAQNFVLIGITVHDATDAKSDVSKLLYMTNLKK